jgi:1,4-alpha-glucan branching enzyme
MPQIIRPSARAGLGTNLYSSGVSFRYWAPFASSLEVIGIDGWTPPGVPLASEGNGYWSADILGIGAGQQYKLIVDGRWRMDPRARDVTHSGWDGKCIVDDPSFAWRHDFTCPPWNELVIYEMHLGTFPDNPAPHGQAFDAAARELDYLRELGINAIHLLPAAEFPVDSSWGYNPAFPFSVESAYGRPSDLKTFVDAAHGFGIAVIMDVVYNHFGPGDEGTWQFDSWIPHWDGSEMGGIYYYPDWRARTPWGAKNRPDYGRPEVREFIRDNALLWTHEFRVDGLRFDAVNYIRTVDGREESLDSPANLGGWGWNLLRWVTDEVRRTQPWKITIAEDMQRNAWITKPTLEGGAGFGSQWDAGFVHPIRHALTQVRDENRNVREIRDAICHSYNGDPFRRVIYTESHDEAAASNGKTRLVDAIAPGDAGGWYARKRSTLGAALMLTSPGIPMICQGQEINEWIPFGDQNRMDWTKLTTFSGINRLFADLIKLRRNWYNNTRGLRGRHVNVFHAGDDRADDRVIAYHRWDAGGPGDDVVVVLNFSNRPYPEYRVGFPRAGRWWLRFNSDWSGYSSDFGSVHAYDTMAGPEGIQDMPYSGNVGLGPYAAIVLSQ